MPSLVENLDDESDVSDNGDGETGDDDFGDEIPDGIPGGRNPPKPRPRNISFARAQPINISGGEPIRRKRGRPPGSGTKSKSRTTDTAAEKFWTELTALGLNLTSVFIAVKVARNQKVIMTKAEAEAAAKALMLVAFKYKQFRELALIVNTDNDWAIIARGFWPYVSRLFIKEIIDDLLRLAFSGPQPERQSGNQSVGNVGQHQSGHDGNDSGDAVIQFFPSATNNRITDWRAL